MNTNSQPASWRLLISSATLAWVWRREAFSNPSLKITTNWSSDGSIVPRTGFDAPVGVFDEVTDRVHQWGRASGAVDVGSEFRYVFNSRRIVDDLERVLAVELHEGEVRASGFPCLLGDERVEASDHVLGQSAHRSRTVEEEPELGRLGNGRVSQSVSPSVWGAHTPRTRVRRRGPLVYSQFDNNPIMGFLSCQHKPDYHCTDGV